MDLFVLAERLKQPFGATAESHKKNLLTYSLLGFAFTLLGLMPEKISFIGVTLKESEQSSLLILLAIAIGYFFITFIVAIWSDLLAWQVLFAQKSQEQLLSIKDNDLLKGVPREMILEQLQIESKLRTNSKVTFFIYLLTNLLVPISVGIAALVFVVLSI